MQIPLLEQDVPADPAGLRPEPRAGYQGQAGSFGFRAASRFGRPEAFPTFEKLLRALVAAEVEAAVLPAVNRVAGPILEPLDALARIVGANGHGAPLAVTAELAVPVRLVLAARPGVRREEIREVLSQPPALRQCRSLLEELDATPIETHDTAYAAYRVAELGGPRAAVSSEEAALEAGLVLLDEDVSDLKPNFTRFWRLARVEGDGRTLDVVPDAAFAVGLAEAGSPAPPRVVYFVGAQAMAALSKAKAELLSLPGVPEAPVRGFAVVPPAGLGALSGWKPADGERMLWLGAPPERKTPPRVKELPKVTAVREATAVRVGPFEVGGGKRAVIAGPCAVESPEQVERLARAVARAGATALRGGVFKPRTSPYAFQGHGLAALEWLRAAGDAVGLPIVTEVMAPAQVGPVAERAQVLQIGARNCQNYDLLKEAGGSGRPVLLKRGFGTTVEEWLSAAEYLLDAGCDEVLLCERGIRTFEKATRGTLDLGGLLAARSMTHLPLLADPSHAAGRRDLVPGLARAAWGAGVDGLIVEVHDAPESALSDGPQALLPEDLEALLDEFGLLPGRSGSIERVRRAIDAADGEITRAVARRLALCRRVADVKRRNGQPIRDEAREATVRRRYVDALRPEAAHEPTAAHLADALIALGLEAEGWAAEAP